MRWSALGVAGDVEDLTPSDGAVTAAADASAAPHCDRAALVGVEHLRFGAEVQDTAVVVGDHTGRTRCAGAAVIDPKRHCRHLPIFSASSKRCGREEATITSAGPLDRAGGWGSG